MNRNRKGWAISNCFLRLISGSRHFLFSSLPHPPTATKFIHYIAPPILPLLTYSDAGNSHTSFHSFVAFLILSDTTHFLVACSCPQARQQWTRYGYQPPTGGFSRLQQRAAQLDARRRPFSDLVVFTADLSCAPLALNPTTTTTSTAAATAQSRDFPLPLWVRILPQRPEKQGRRWRVGWTPPQMSFPMALKCLSGTT